jgi:hypothetical protein
MKIIKISILKNLEIKKLLYSQIKMEFKKNNKNLSIMNSFRKTLLNTILRIYF